MRSILKTHGKTAHKTLEDVSPVLRCGSRSAGRKGKCYNFVTTPRWSDRDSGTKHTRQWYLELQNENMPPSSRRYDDG